MRLGFAQRLPARRSLICSFVGIVCASAFVSACHPFSNESTALKTGAKATQKLDSVRKVISTRGAVTPLFTWFSHEGRGAELIANPPAALQGKLTAAWERVQRENTAAYDAQGGAGTYFAEDPFSSYEFGDTLLVAFPVAQDVKVSDYFGPGVDDPDQGAPDILNAALKEDIPAFRYNFAGWFGGKAVVVRQPSFLDLAPGRQFILKRPAEMRPFHKLDVAELRGLVGKPWMDVLPKIIDQAGRFESMHRYIFPETDFHTRKPPVPVFTRDGKLTDGGVMWYARETLAKPSDDLRSLFEQNKARLGVCGERGLSVCATSFSSFMEKKQPGTVPLNDFAAMLQTMGMIPPNAQPRSADEFNAALLAFYGPRVRPVAEALSAIVLDMHAQLGKNCISAWGH